MKLYSSTICFGLLLVFICPKEKPLVISDFCQTSGHDIERLKVFSNAELSVLERPKKEAILSLRRKYERDCTKSK